MVAMPPINIVASNVYGPKASDVVAKGIIKKYHISGDVIKQNNIKPTTNSLDVFSLILFVANANAFQDGSRDFYASQEPTLP